MKTKVLLVVLAASALLTTPSSANWFHNPHLNINRNVGSAPNPTPQDLRENRLPILVRDEGSGDHPILEALKSMFGGSKTAVAQPQPKLASAQGNPTAPPSR